MKEELKQGTLGRGSQGNPGPAIAAEGPPVSSLVSHQPARVGQDAQAESERKQVALPQNWPHEREHQPRGQGGVCENSVHGTEDAEPA